MYGSGGGSCPLFSCSPSSFGRHNHHHHFIVPLCPHLSIYLSLIWWLLVQVAIELAVKRSAYDMCVNDLEIGHGVWQFTWWIRYMYAYTYHTSFYSIPFPNNQFRSKQICRGLFHHCTPQQSIAKHIFVFMYVSFVCVCFAQFMLTGTFIAFNSSI